MSEFRNLIVSLVAGVRDFAVEGQRRLAARWPHGRVAGSPAAVNAELDQIGEWMKIPRPMVGQDPMDDARYRETLKRPFEYHQAKGTVIGIIRAVEAMGYRDVVYLDWFELDGAVTNQNAFGLRSSNFPVAAWSLGDAFPPGLVGERLKALVSTVIASKRASSSFVQIRTSDALVVTQSWWDGGQVGDPGFVIPQTGVPGEDYVVAEGG